MTRMTAKLFHVEHSAIARNISSLCLSTQGFMFHVEHLEFLSSPKRLGTIVFSPECSAWKMQGIKLNVPVFGGVFPTWNIPQLHQNTALNSQVDSNYSGAQILQQKIWDASSRLPTRRVASGRPRLPSTLLL